MRRPHASYSSCPSCGWWLAVATLLLLPASLWSAEPVIYFHTSPRVETLHPLSQPATLSILVTESDGRPVREGWVEVELEAPKPGRWFSTDFPLVEGSRLIDVRLPLSRGKVGWKYLFPIRGEYRLKVNYVTEEGTRTSRVFAFAIREHGTKWLLLTAFTLGLFGLGLFAGRIFSAAAPGAGQNAARAVMILAGCLGPAHAGAVSTQGAGPFTGRLEIGPAVVGRPTSVQWRLEGGARAAHSRAALTLTVTHLEKGAVVFAVEKLPVEREFSVDFHFTDGAEYRVRAVADLPPVRSVRTEQILSVAGAEPPAGASLPAIAFFIFVLAGGLAAGRWSRGRIPLFHLRR